MKIRSILHKGLREFIENDDQSGIDTRTVPKLSKMITFLEGMKSPDELYYMKSWHAHRLKGEFDNHWSLTVTRNWRLIFRIAEGEIEILDLNLIDYH